MAGSRPFGNELIVSGPEVPIGEFRSLVRVYFTDPTTRQQSLQTGTVIGPNVILTTAHGNPDRGTVEVSYRGSSARATGTIRTFNGVAAPQSSSDGSIGPGQDSALIFIRPGYSITGFPDAEMPVEDGWGEGLCCDTQNLTQLGFGSGALDYRIAPAQLANPPAYIRLTGGAGTQGGDSGGPILAPIAPGQRNTVNGNVPFAIVGVHVGQSGDVGSGETLATRITPEIHRWINETVATENSVRIRYGYAFQYLVAVAAFLLYTQTAPAQCGAPW
jgi:hypothetical protein